MPKAQSQRGHEKILRRRARQAIGKVRRGGMKAAIPQKEISKAERLASMSSLVKHLLRLNHDAASCSECQRKSARKRREAEAVAAAEEAAKQKDQDNG